MPLLWRLRRLSVSTRRLSRATQAQTQANLRFVSAHWRFQRSRSCAGNSLPSALPNRIMIRSQWDKFKQGLNIGFIRADNRLVVDVEECPIAEPAINEQIKEVRRHPPPKGGLKVVLRISPEGWEVPRDSFFQNNFFLLPKLVEVTRDRLRDAG